MALLALDTASGDIAVCVYDTKNNRSLSSRTETLGKGHAEHLLPMIDTGLKEAGLSYSDITKVAVTSGPGSFTGLRVGLSAARGFALALSVPAVGISVLDCLIHHARELGGLGPIVAAIDARRDEAYVQIDTDAHAPDNGSPRLMLMDDLAAQIENGNYALCGSAAQKIVAMTNGPTAIIHDLGTAPIEVLAKLGAKAEAQPEGPVPLYLRSADAKPQTGFALPHA